MKIAKFFKKNEKKKNEMYFISSYKKCFGILDN